MKRIFLKAAQLIDSGLWEYSCNALDAAGHNFNISDISRRYALIISPTEGSPVRISDFELDESKRGAHGHRVRSKGVCEHRVIALLMVGEAWKDLQKGGTDEGR